MKILRCFLFAAIVVISSATFALGGEIQGPAQKRSQPDSDTNGVNNRVNKRRSDTADVNRSDPDWLAGRHGTAGGDPTHNLLITLGYN